MCRIITICNYQKDLLEFDEKFKRMTRLINKQTCTFMSPHLHMACTSERIRYRKASGIYTIAFEGEIYNLLDIKTQLIQKGYTFQTTFDEEVILTCYLEYQENCLDLFEGAFVFVIDDGSRLFIARDQLGIKPLYYYQDDRTLVVASEIKCILEYIGKAIVDEEGIKELLGLGPSLTPGHTLYQNIFSLRPGYYMLFDGQLKKACYWRLHDETHHENLEETITHVRKLVIESIQKQLSHPQQLASMLSGGLDSSIVSAIASQYVSPLPTYSITYEDQEKYFKAYDYQTTMDDDFIQEMNERYPSLHQKIVLHQVDLVQSLQDSLIARDMPGMADVDSSLLLFSKEIAKKQSYALSGECADEIFGGYPWFYKEDLYNQPYFPWMRNIDQKIDLFNDKVKALNIQNYIMKRYQESLSEISTPDKKKQLIYLNSEWFMQTLLARADTQSSQSSLRIRVPFASTKIFQYLYNMPLEFMYLNNEEKGILRKAFEDYLPEDVAHRKKNPYPKTHSPLYTQLIYDKLKESLNDPSNILYSFFDKSKLLDFVDSKGESFQYPWFGQLMTSPQLMAYFYQIYLWGKLYHIELQF